VVTGNVSYDADDLNADYDLYEDEPYRAVSSAAVVSLVFGIASILAFLDWLLLFLPSVGLIAGLMAGRKIRRYPEEFSGGALARTGTLLSLLAIVAAPGWLWYSMITEAPEGYLRISYAELQPDRGAPPTEIPRSANELEGKRVFIKGFMYPGPERTGIRRFILCRDNGTCCFGGVTPKPSDMVDVLLNSDLKAEYVTRMTRVGGVFHVDPNSSGTGMDARYHLEADYIR
jgi:hypothetical protein